MRRGSARPVPRVLLVDHTGQEGGGELALLRLAEVLRERGSAQLRALVLAEGPFVGRLRSAGVPVVVLALDPAVATTDRHRVLAPTVLFGAISRAVDFVPRLVRAIRASGAEIVVANSLKAAVLVAVAAPLAGRPWVWHLHDRLAHDYLPAPLVHLTRLLAVVGPRRIVVNSQATLATLPRRARSRAHLAYPGLPDSAFVAASRAPADTAIGLIGRISPTKGQREFVEAAALVGLERPDVQFRVIGAALFGEGRYESELRDLPRLRGIERQVDFTGWVADPGWYLRQLTVLVHASPVPEPFGQVVVEAMAAGVPVIAAAAGGTVEILDPDGERPAGAGWWPTRLGVLVEPGDVLALADALRHTLTDASAREDRASRAKEDARARFPIEATADAVEAAWKEPWRSARTRHVH